MPDSASTATMPCMAVMSSNTPPKTGTDAASTPLRPPAAVTGTLFALQSASTLATSAVPAGRAITNARCGTSPASDQCNASGHQSRLASAVATMSSSVVQISESRTRNPSGSGGGAGKRVAVPVSSIGAVGCVTKRRQ